MASIRNKWDTGEGITEWRYRPFIKMVKPNAHISSQNVVFAVNNAIRQMQQATEAGYEITMIFVGLNDVTQNIERVALRVKNGGTIFPPKIF